MKLCQMHILRLLLILTSLVAAGCLQAPATSDMLPRSVGIRPSVPSVGPLTATADYRAPPAANTSRWRPLKVRVRAYTPWDPIDARSPYRDGLTATLKDTRKFPHQWGIAACPSVLPYGTIVRVPGYHPTSHRPADSAWEVDDTGAIIRRHAREWRAGDRDLPLIEVRFIHQRSAREWGTRVLTVWVKDGA